MKKLFCFAVLAALGLVGVGCQTNSGSHGTVVVNYDHPEKFTDFKSDYSRPTSQVYMDDLREYLQHRAGRLIPAGETLTLNFTDIDMAGDITPMASSVRVQRPIYPLKINFTWVITDAGGKIVTQGTEKLVNAFAGSQMGFDRDDPLFHEKAQMDDWIRHTLR